MKVIAPMAGIDCKNTMTKISHAEGTDHQGITKIIMKESIIIHFRTMEIGENIKRVIKTSIGKKIINIREGLEIIMKMSMKTGIIGMNMNTNTESYNLGRDRSREKQHECNARKTPYFSKLELVDSTIRKLDQRKVLTERFIKAVAEDIDDLFDSTCSSAEVRCWLAKKYIQVKDQKAENENSTVDHHVNITGNGSPQNYEFKNAELEVTLEAVDTEIIEISDSDSKEEMQNLNLCECEVIDELDFRELEQIPQVMVKLTEGQVLEEFMLEDIDFQGRDQNVELPNKQQVDREMVVWPNMSVETSYGQEECAEMETCNMSLPGLFKAKESVHVNEVELGVNKVDEVEIRELPREVKLEIPIEQDKPNLHTKWKKVLGSKIIRRANPTKLVKR